MSVTHNAHVVVHTPVSYTHLDRAVAIAPAEAELRADVARELPRRRHHPRLDLHFLRLAVKLRQQAVNYGNYRCV